jgi:hypothetical protein
MKLSGTRRMCFGFGTLPGIRRRWRPH